jgi:hypothetical protein
MQVSLPGKLLSSEQYVPLLQQHTTPGISWHRNNVTQHHDILRQHHDSITQQRSITQHCHSITQPSPPPRYTDYQVVLPALLKDPPAHLLPPSLEPEVAEATPEVVQPVGASDAAIMHAADGVSPLPSDGDADGGVAKKQKLDGAEESGADVVAPPADVVLALADSVTPVESESAV